jgi:hypothetical protein
MKKTAVDFLSEKYMYVTWLRNRDEISAEQADKMRLNYLLESKQMEKEQIEYSYYEAWTESDNYYRDEESILKIAEKYYNETYNDNK